MAKLGAPLLFISSAHGLVPPPASKTSAAAQDPEALPPCWPIAGSVQLCLDGEEAEGTAAHA